MAPAIGGPTVSGREHRANRNPAKYIGLRNPSLISWNKYVRTYWRDNDNDNDDKDKDIDNDNDNANDNYNFKDNDNENGTYALSSPFRPANVEGDWAQHGDETAVKQAHQAAEQHQGLEENVM